MAKQGAQQKTQKNQQVMDMTDDQARAHIEAIRWPNGPGCVHCGSVNVYRMEGKTTRAGLFACRDCRGHFSVTVGTVMEDSHLPLRVWVRAFHLMATSKKGMSALQLQRNLGLGSYRTAWHLAHRIREAMRCEPVAGLLAGKVEADETYVGGKPRKYHGRKLKSGRGTEKTPVAVLVERDGRSRAKVVPDVTSTSLRRFIKRNVDRSNSTLFTDEWVSYKKIGEKFAGGHKKVCHGLGEYAFGDAHVNSCESWNALLKRGIVGTFHHVSKEHLQRYCDEFCFRWDGRQLSDASRRDLAIQQIEGKRLMYRQPAN